MSKKILVIEDDRKISELIEINLKDNAYQCDCVYDGLEGLKAGKSNVYDLILIDINLPSMNGLDVCQSIRSENSEVPIIMITAKAEEIDKVIGLDSGADDYITKPFSIRELLARIRAVFRRLDKSKSSEQEQDYIQAGDLEIDIDKRILKKNKSRIDLTTKEFDLLSFLASNPGKSFRRENLLNLVWGYDFVGIEHTVNSHINRLRSKSKMTSLIQSTFSQLGGMDIALMKIYNHEFTISKIIHFLIAYPGNIGKYCWLDQL